MNYFILITIVSVVILGWLYHRSKFLSYSIMVILFLLTCFSYDSYDYINYSYMFSVVAEGGTVSYEYLFEMLFKIASMLHINYDQLRFITTIIQLCLIQSTVKRYCGYSAFFWSMFIVFPGWLLTTLFRFALGLSIIVFAIRYLLEEPDENLHQPLIMRGRKILTFSNRDIMKMKFITCVITASFFHSSFWVFLPFVMVNSFKPKTVLLISCFTVAFIYSASGIQMVNRVFTYFGLREDFIGLIYSREFRSTLGIIYNFLKQGLISFVGMLAVYFYKKQNYRCGFVNKLQDNFMHMLIPINYISILFLSLAYFMPNSRLTYFLLIYNLIACGICINNGNSSKFKISWDVLFIKLVALFLTLTLSYLMCTRDSDAAYDMVLMMLFETNTFINFFNGI